MRRVHLRRHTSDSAMPVADPQLAGQSVVDTCHPVTDRRTNTRVNQGLVLESSNMGRPCKSCALASCEKEKTEKYALSGYKPASTGQRLLHWSTCSCCANRARGGPWQHGRDGSRRQDRTAQSARTWASLAPWVQASAS